MAKQLSIPMQAPAFLQGVPWCFCVFMWSQGVCSWQEQSVMLPPLISMAWAAWETGAGIGARPGMAIEPGIAAMANTSATAMAIQDRALLFPTRIMCKLELIQPESNRANRHRGAPRLGMLQTIFAGLQR